MNILLHRLPTFVILHGKPVKIRTDFRFGLRCVMASEDNGLAQVEKGSVILSNMYFEVPKDIDEAVERAVLFLNMNHETDEETDMLITHRPYSLLKDGNLIYAAFRQTHGIDLSTAKLHWWKFMALFLDLGSDTVFCNLVSLRQRVNSGKASKEEKKEARELGDIFEVEDIDTRTLEEREAAEVFMKAVGGGR